jgi:hypothetical protein
MAGPGRSDRLVLRNIARFDRQLFFPVFPVPVRNLDRDWRSDRFAVAHAGQNMNLVRLDLHPPAAAIPLLPPPKLAIDEFKVDRNARRQTGDERDQCLAVRLPGSFKSNHDLVIIRE